MTCLNLEIIFPTREKTPCHKICCVLLVYSVYVFLINCGLSLVCIYVGGRFSLDFNLVKSTVSMSDAQCEICLTKLVLAFLRVRSCSSSSGHQQPSESQQQTCKTLFPALVTAFSACVILFLRTIPTLRWSQGSRSRDTELGLHRNFPPRLAVKQCMSLGTRAGRTTWAGLSVQLPDLVFKSGWQWGNEAFKLTRVLLVL